MGMLGHQLGCSAKVINALTTEPTLQLQKVLLEVYFMCMRVCLYLCLSATCVWYPQRPEKDDSIFYFHCIDKKNKVRTLKLLSGLCNYVLAFLVTKTNAQENQLKSREERLNWAHDFGGFSLFSQSKKAHIMVARKHGGRMVMLGRVFLSSLSFPLDPGPM